AFEKGTQICVQRFAVLNAGFQQVSPLGLPPQVTKLYDADRRVRFPADKQTDRCANLNSFRIMFSRENAWIGLALWRQFSRLVFVAIQRVDPNSIKRLQITLSHSREGQPVQPRVVGNEADDAAAGHLHDAPLDRKSVV